MTGPAAADPRAPAGLTVLAVDDERPALEDLARVLRANSLVGRVETAGAGAQALRTLSEIHVDVIFLDVRMPGLDGVELARVLRQFADPPDVVFVTAYESAAVEAFALGAVDYVMKPVGRARVQEALERVRPRHRDDGSGGGGAEVAARPDADVVPVDNLRGGTRLLPRASILFLEARGDYVRIHADDGRFLLRARLGDIAGRWAPFGFVRVHRGYVVNLRRAVEVRPHLNGTAVIVLADGAEVPISRRQVGELRRRLGT